MEDYPIGVAPPAKAGPPEADPPKEEPPFGVANLDIEALPSPAFLVDRNLIRKNLKVLSTVRERTGAKILLAQKGFSMFSLYQELSRVLDGVCASGLYEARLGREYFPGEVHTYAPAFREEEIPKVLALSDHLLFNSFDQWSRFSILCIDYAKTIRPVSFGLRVNPEVSTAEHAIYDPCAPGSRLGITKSQFRPDLLEGIEGLHFHALCEQNSDDLEEVLQGFDRRFGGWAKTMKWINFGGGHHITRPDYNQELLCQLIDFYGDRYNAQIYLEPGEAVALNTGIFISTVLDVVENGRKIAILDSSVTCHMPDVLEMPYRPEIWGAGEPKEKAFTYRLGGVSCLAGDVVGDYSFDHPLQVGEKLIFGDMAHYSMVKTTTFNGVPLPSILLHDPQTGETELIKTFSYEDFRSRLS